MIRFFLAIAISVCLVATLPAQDAPPVFGQDVMHDLHLTLSAKEWERMQKVSGGLTLFPPKKPVAKDGEEPFEWHKSPGFGLEFPWVHADLVANGKALKNVGLRYKGNGSYVSSGEALKRNLKIEIDHYTKDQRWFGLRTLTLNAGAVDQSRLREALAYSVFRAAGVPAPRTAFAKVSLSVEGKYTNEFLGVYTLVELVNKDFLKQHFKAGDGLLMKPERQVGIVYLGDDWKKYQDRYYPKRDATPKEIEHIIAFAKLISKADDDAFKKDVGNYLDIDNFLRFIAVNTMLPNTDSFLTTGHNYYLYLNPRTNKLAFMPWDLDIAFAGFPLMGTIEQQTHMNLLKPSPNRIKLVDRLLAIPEVNERYRKIVIEIAGVAFTRQKLLSEVDAMAKLVAEPLAQEKKAKDARQEKVDKFGAWVVGFFEPQPPIRMFVERRTAAVSAQVLGIQQKK